MKSENYEICSESMISKVEAVEKIWEDFKKVITYVGYRMRNREEDPKTFEWVS